MLCRVNEPLARLTAALADRYRIERELGAGGTATVYLARDLKHERQVAIKVLHAELSAVLGAERFLAEIKLTANLQHPHILPLFDSGSANGLLFYVMPYVEGETLRALLQREHRLTVPDALRLASDVADALAYAHRRGIIHRDIKPENILLQEGRPLVADFGIARAVTTQDATRITQTGVVLGTPGYMSPEQISGDPNLDGRSDQYGLACVLYEMLAAVPPFTGPSAEAILVQRFTQAAPHVSATRPGIPHAVDSAIHRAMSRDPAERFATITGFAEALRAETGRARASDEKSIAVLPFENISPDRETDYFADGMTDEIINALTQLPDLRVVARTSVFSFKGKHDDLRAIGEKLQVRHVVEGTVRKAGNRLRITVQLVSVADGFHIWSERYDREMDDVFAIQDDIATTIAAKLKVTLAFAGIDQLIKPATGNLDAYDEYLKGMALMHRRGIAIFEAIESFRRAIALDANYAPALAGLAHAQVLASFWGILDPKDVRTSALDAASRALAAGPELVEAHVAAAMVAIGVEFDRAKAARAWDRAIELGPTDVDARANRAVFHLCYVCGDFEESERELRIALDCDPLNPTLQSQLGLVLAFGGRAAEAVAQARRAIALKPDALFGQWILILALLVGQAYDEVITTGIAIMGRFGRNGWVLLGMAGAYAALGRSEAAAIFDELLARSRTEYVQPAVLAMIAMDLGRRDDALRWWAQAAADRDMLMVAMLLHAPISARLRAQPEHLALLRQMGWDTPLRPEKRDAMNHRGEP